MAPDFSVSPGALYFPGSAPILAAGRQIWENRGGGGDWVLRAASHGLSDLLTPLGLRPQALPTLVNKEAPFKAVPQWAAASPPGQAFSEPRLLRRKQARMRTPFGHWWQLLALAPFHLSSMAPLGHATTPSISFLPWHTSPDPHP